MTTVILVIVTLPLLLLLMLLLLLLWLWTTSGSGLDIGKECRRLRTIIIHDFFDNGTGMTTPHTRWWSESR
jgi:hypothetical protein